jgi:hypothetical protein
VADLSRFEPIFQAAGAEWNVDPTLLKAMATQESAGKPRAVSSAGAQGLMQIIPSTQRALGVTDPFDPVQSIYAGAKYMDEALSKEGRPDLALLYYHGGPGWRDKYGKESAGYVPAVTGHFQKLIREAANQPTSAQSAPDQQAAPSPEVGNAMAKKDDKIESDEEFLKRTGNVSGAESDDDFLKRTGAVGGETTAKVEDAPPGPYSEYGDLAAQPWAQGTPPAADSYAPLLSAGKNILDATVEGWRSFDPEAPETANNNQQSYIGQYFTHPLVQIGSVPFRAAAAVGAGLGQTAYEAGNALDPRLGRDAYMAAQVLGALGPQAAMPGAGMKSPVAPEVNQLQPKFIREQPGAAPPRPEGMTDAERIKQLIQHDTPETEPSRPTPEIPATTAGVAEGEPHKAWVGDTVGQIKSLVEENAAAGGPKDLSAAATPTELANMSPQMAKAYRRMAEVNRVVSPIEGEDTSTMVPGSIPTEAEAKGDPVTSQKEVMTRQRRPEVYEGPQGRLTQNDAARTRLYDDQTLSDPQIETLNEDQAKQARKDTATVIAKAGPVDAAPEAARLKRVLADPRIQEQPDIVKVLQPIHDALYDADGNLKTDIQSFWGMHDNLMNKLAKAKDPLQASSSEKFAFNQILDAKNAVDELMNKASGGAFQTFLDNQAEFFKSKNAATILRDFRPKMINQKTGAIDANRFHRFVTDLAVRRGKPGIDAAMDIPDEVMGNLMNIDDDLKRAGRIDLGKPRGSPTNLYFELAKGLGIAGAHSLAAGLGPVGNVGVQIGVGALQRMSANMRLNKLVEQSLNYPPGKDPRITPSPNPPGRFVPPVQRNPLTPP